MIRLHQRHCDVDKLLLSKPECSFPTKANIKLKLIVHLYYCTLASLYEQPKRQRHVITDYLIHRYENYIASVKK